MNPLHAFAVTTKSHGAKPNSKVYKIILSAVTIAFLTYLMYLAPHISDDFIFADLTFHNISSLLNYVFHYGNGRVLGNLSAVIFVQNKFLCAAVRAIIIYLLILVVAKISAPKPKPATFVVSLLIILGMSPEMFGQVFTWTSGFMNYVPSVLITLSCIYIIQHCCNPHLFWFLSLFVLGVAGQLYAEHSTLINVLISGMMWIYYTKQHNSNRKHLTGIWLLGCILGAIIMLLVPTVFGNSTSPLEGYRKIALTISGILSNTKDCLFSTLVYYAQSSAIWCIASIAAITISSHSTKPTRRIRQFIYWTYPIISIIYNINYAQVSSIWDFRFILLGGGLCIYLICFLYEVFSFAIDRNVKLRLLNWLFLIIVSIIPFCIVRPFSARCVFLSYIFACVFIIEIFIFSTKSIHKKISVHMLIPAALSITLSVILLFEFINIGKLDEIRKNHIAHSMDKEETAITVFEFPSRYTYTTWLLHKQYYYETPNDIEFTVVDYDTWLCQQLSQSEVKP